MQAIGAYGAGGSGSTVKARDHKDATDLVVSTESASFDGRDVHPTMRATNGTPGYDNANLFSQQSAYLARVDAPDGEIVTMDKEAYNAGKNQTGGLGIQTENRTPAPRATGHAPAIAKKEKGE